MPIGGGGLASGIAVALKELRPEIRIVGVQAASCAPLAGEEPSGFTIADGIAVKKPGVLTSAILENRLGPVLFQLPPYLRKDAGLLASFLDLLPPTIPAAFEFRHASWLDDEVLDLLAGRDRALCVAETEDGLDAPRLGTAGWGYLRLRRTDYGDDELAEWAERIAAEGWSDAYVFFKHEDEAEGPKFAERFLKLARALPE